MDEEELYYDTVSGKVMIKELVDAARRVEMETFKMHVVHEKVRSRSVGGVLARPPGGSSG